MNRQQFYQFVQKEMKESYIRSKIQLKPISSTDLNTKKGVVDYQQYEEKLSSYYKKNKGPDISELFDWTKPSEIISLKRPLQPQAPVLHEPEVIPNNSMNTEELLRSEHDADQHHSQNQLDLDDSIDVELPSHSPKPTYVEMIKGDYGSEYRIMSQIKIQSQLKEMRERIIEMNGKLNKMLDRYQLLANTAPKKQVQIVNPYNFLSAQIELNIKIIQKQLEQMKEIEQKDKQLEKKDFLVQLQELIIQIKKQIHDIEKEKHLQEVDVEKINKLLKEYETMEEGDEYRQVKDLKVQIVYYFKKLKENKLVDQQLDKEIQSLTNKDAVISQKFNGLNKVAIKDCLEVSSNKPYLELKRRYDELVATGDSHRKKKQISLRCFKMAEEKMEKEITVFKKQIQRCEMESQQLEYRAQTIDEETTEFINKNSLLTRQLKSISYKFDQSLIHPQKGKFKPDFRRGGSRLSRDKVNKTIDGITDESRKYSSINDKNVVSHEIPQNIEQSENSDASRMKPILRSWKGKTTQNARYSPMPEKYNTIQNSNIFKLPLLGKSRK